MKEFILRDAGNRIVSRIRKVQSSEASDKLAGERTLRITTLLDNGLERMSEGQQYTLEFEEDLYDVISLRKTMSGNLCFAELSCEHISYRLNRYQKEKLSLSGTAAEILSALLAGTGFQAESEVPSVSIAYTRKQSATVRALLLDFAGRNGWDLDFRRKTVTILPHRGSTDESRILQKNVQEISKTIDLSDNSIGYALKLKPRTEIRVGDEVHLIFERLQIDDHVRVLGIRRQPFVCEDITVEVGSYMPTLEADSANTATVSQLGFKADKAELDEAMESVQEEIRRITANVDDASAALELKASKDAVNGLQDALASVQTTVGDANSGLVLWARQKDQAMEVLNESLASLSAGVDANMTELTMRVTNSETDTESLWDAIAALTVTVGDTTTGLLARVTNAEADILAGTELYIKEADLEAKIGVYKMADGLTMAQMQADLVSLRANLTAEIQAKLVNITGMVNVSGGSMTVNGNLSVTGAYAIQALTGTVIAKKLGTSSEFWIKGVEYKPTNITSTTGTVKVLGAA